MRQRTPPPFLFPPRRSPSAPAAAAASDSAAAAAVAFGDTVSKVASDAAGSFRAMLRQALDACTNGDAAGGRSGATSFADVSPDTAAGALLAAGYILSALSALSGMRSGLMAVGQVALVLGYVLQLGVHRAWELVYRPDCMHGTVLLVAGFALTVMHLTVAGTLLECLGLAFLGGYDRMLAPVKK
ncbi:hypothetical protein HK405_001349 [Cladochytrium tenue]|nr:hypothetical protein HK405_001349 [Cladochytrium tenue]